MSQPPRSREEIERRRDLRRRQVRRRRVGALVVVLVLAGGAVGAALALTGETARPEGSAPAVSTEAAMPVAAGETAEGEGQPRARPDGSLGAKNVRQACTLLEKSEIKAQFGGPVGRPTGVWPYCEWLVGKDAWVAAWVSTKTPFERVRDRSYVLEDVAGVGDDAFFGTDRYLYFSGNGASYWVLYQKTNEFVEIHRDELIALARAMLAKPLDAELPRAGSGESEPVQIAKPTREEPLRLYFGGDSLSAGPEWAFRTQADKTKLIRSTSEYQVGTGLIRNDYFDWRRHLEGVVRARQPQVAVFMAGANDSQDFVVKGQYYPNTTGTWHRLYRKRVAEIMDTLAADGRKVVWVGMPPMRDPDLNAGMAEVNEVFASEAGKRADSVTYVDTWELFSGPAGGYTDTLDGEQVRLEDGIHLNVPGSERLADAISAAVADIAGAPELAGNAS